MIGGGLLALFTGLALASHIGAFTHNFQPGVTYVPDSTFWALVSFTILGWHRCLGWYRRPICCLDWSGDQHQSTCGQDVVQCPTLVWNCRDRTKLHWWLWCPARMGFDDSLPGRRT